MVAVTITLSLDYEIKEEGYKVLAKLKKKPSHFFRECLEKLIEDERRGNLYG